VETRKSVSKRLTHSVLNLKMKEQRRMKHKLTVLACVGLALLLSTGFAFAQNTISVADQDVDRCATTLVDVILTNTDGVGAIGLPLTISGGTLVSVTAGAGLAGWTTAINHSGNKVIVNAVGGACLNAGVYSILTLEITTPDDCSGDIIVDLDGAPAVPASLLLAGCDCCELPADFAPGALTLVNNAPTCGVNSNENLDWQASIVDKQLNANDLDACDGLAFSPVSGPGSIDASGLFNWDPDCADVGDHTVTFEVSDDCGATVQCSFDITVTQTGPVCDAVAPQSVHWLDHLSVALPANDDGCPSPLVWTLDGNGGLGGTLSVAGGTLEYDPVCGDVPGTYLVEYTVSDGALDCSESVEVTVTNDAPTVVCPTPVDAGFLCDGGLVDGNDGIFNLGELVSGQAIGDDANGDPLTYSIISAPATVNAPAIDGSGNFSWQSDGNDAEGDYEFCIEVSDGCAADTCCFTVTMDLNFYVSIKDASGTVDTIPSLPGEIACVYVNIFPGLDLGGLDLLLCYDQSSLSFLGGIDAIGDLAEWEYFTYRYGANSNCSGSCPSGLIRVVAIADMDNGPQYHPSDDAFGLEGNVIEICFQVTSDWNFLGQCLPIGFCSYDCGDNTLSSKDGNTLYVAHGSLAACPDPKPGYDAAEEIDFCGGAICVREPEDARGDLNLNFIANEIGDAVLYSSYFISGIDVFSADAGNRAVQIQASDVNNDGVELTVADLIYLIRIITGDAQPFPSDNGQPKVAPYANSATVITNAKSGSMVVTTDATVDLGGAVLVFRYSDVSVGQAVTTDASEAMVVSSRANRGEYRVLITPDMDAPRAIASGRNQIVEIPYEGNGTIELVEIQLADAEGQLLSTDQLAKIQPPTSYSLLQNYPNPFNAGTVIRFDLKDASDWNLTVYNITGQVVRTFSGSDEASQVSVEWDGRDNNGSEAASGVYLYRVDAGDFTSSKKMTLIK
jgi:hypothetical protein